MRHEVTTHGEVHEERIRRLAEEGLTGEEQRKAEQDLLTCDLSLDEYNQHRQLGPVMTSPDYTEQRERYLATADPARHQLYQQKLDRVMTNPTEARGPMQALTLRGLWVHGLRKGAWAFSALCLVI